MTKTVQVPYLLLYQAITTIDGYAECEPLGGDSNGPVPQYRPSKELVRELQRALDAPPPLPPPPPPPPPRSTRHDAILIAAIDALSDMCARKKGAQARARFVIGALQDALEQDAA